MESDLEPQDEMGEEALRAWGGNQAVYDQVRVVVRNDPDPKREVAIPRALARAQTAEPAPGRTPINWGDMQRPDRSAWQMIVRRALSS